MIHPQPSRSFLVVAAFVVAAPVFAQSVCPVDPLSRPSNRWTFNATAPAVGAGASTVGASTIAGTFVATTNAASTGGLLSIISTHVSTAGTGNSVSRYQAGTGRYFFNADCTSGSLFMNIAYFPAQFDFSVAANATFGFTVTLRATGVPVLPTFPTPPSPTGYTNASQGTAWPAPSGCPAGIGTSINLISGNYNFSLSNVGPVTTGTIVAGNILTPTYLNRRQLTVTPGLPATPQGGVSPFPQANYGLYADTGHAIIDDNCLVSCWILNTSQTREFQYDGFSRIALNGEITYVLINTGAGIVPSTPPSNFAVSTGFITR